MADQNEDKVLIIWQCDKRDCEQINRRWIPRDHLLFDDVCEKCNRKIHEPITDKIINAKGEKEE